MRSDSGSASSYDGVVVTAVPLRRNFVAQFHLRCVFSQFERPFYGAAQI